ncbi:MAG: hypothetical protein JOZ10_00750 [Acidobacteria bacterium]|nr:hypothetical protein [Acidobacteriota bacterium]MBV9144897.1 hypothetical protein [Acidobacteriota bacterium]
MKTLFSLIVLLFLAMASFADVNVSAPADGSSVGSPVHIVAQDGNAIAMHIYVDNNDAYQIPANALDTYLPVALGTHYVVVQSWDAYGNVFKTPLTINVSGAGSAAAPAAAPTFAQIQAMDSWDSCSVCAGNGGNGPGTDHGLQQGIGTPSLSGSSSLFTVGGAPWGAALWWRELGGNDGAYNLHYSLDFYMEDPSAAQALEFDVNQTAGGLRYIFGTECDIKDSGTWRVWNSQNRQWVSTGAPCPAPYAYAWNHLEWQFQRTGGGVHFVSVTLNGQTYNVDYWFPALGQNGSGLDVAFQADLDGSGRQVAVWLDNVSLSLQ